VGLSALKVVRRLWIGAGLAEERDLVGERDLCSG